MGTSLETTVLGMIVMVLQGRLEQHGAYKWQKATTSLPWLCLLGRSGTYPGFAAEHEVPRYFSQNSEPSAAGLLFEFLLLKFVKLCFTHFKLGKRKDKLDASLS